MFTSIPYNHPSLVLGNIADTNVMKLLDEIVKNQSIISAAQEKMTSLIQMKRSMAMTVSELKSMDINMSAVDVKLKELDKNINDAANHYLEVFLTKEDDIQKLKTELTSLGCGTQTIASPIDLKASPLVAKPLFSDSLRLDSQYFSAGEVTEEEMVGNLEKFVKNSAGTGADTLAKAASEQIVNQSRNKRLCGTLVVVANCTHRNVEVFDPLVIDPEKAIRAWNEIHPQSRIEAPKQVAESAKSDDSLYITLITGAAYGSSFVGMVHILQTEKAQTVDFEGIKADLEQKLKMAGWLSHINGNLGIDSKYLDEVKSMLSSKSISTHISIVTMGAISPLKSNELQTGAMEVLNISDNNKKQARGAFQTVTSASNATAEKLHETEVKSKKVTDLMKVIAQVELEQNSTFNINSLMTALDNYIKMASTKQNETIIGIPISFFTQRFSKKDILELWCNQNLAIPPPKRSV